MKNRLIAIVAGVGLAAGGLVVTAPAARAECGYGDPVSLQSLFTSQTYAGVKTTARIPFVLKYSNAGCLQGMIFTFVGGGGSDVQAVRASVTTSGVSGEATAEFVPKAMTYKLLVDVVYKYGYMETLTTSRWTYDSMFGDNRAFAVLPAPSAPSNVNVEANNRSIRVRWSTPTSNASAVTEYLVTRLENGEVLCRTTIFYCDANDLPDGAYTFRVKANNQIGAGGETQTQGILVAPPQAPVISSSTLINGGRDIELGWYAQTGTSAVPLVYRIYDSAGVEVCGRPVASGEVAGPLACTVSPPKAGSAYTLKVETAMGDNISAPTAVLKPDPNSFFRTCSKEKGSSRDCLIGKSWKFERCTSQKGKTKVTTSGGSKVKNVKANKSSKCPKKKPYLTNFSVTEKKKGTGSYNVALPDGSKTTVRVTVRETE